MTEARPTEPLDEGAAIVDDVRRRTRLPAHVTPEAAISAVMCTLSRHLSAGEARHVWSSLPRQLEPLLEPCLLHRGETAARFGRMELVQRVSEHLGAPLPEAEHITSSVISAISARLPGSAVHHVASQLPRDLRELWVATSPPLEGEHPLFRQITQSVALPSDISAGTALSAVICLLTRGMDIDHARRLVTSLPRGVRPIVEPCLERGPEPDHIDRDVFLGRLAMALHTNSPEPIVRTVFQAVQIYLPQEIVKHATAQLPRDLQDLWANP